jgi:hypothetical protein
MFSVQYNKIVIIKLFDLNFSIEDASGVGYLVRRLLHEIDEDRGLDSGVSSRFPKLFEDFEFLQCLRVPEVLPVEHDGVGAPQLVPEQE